MNGGDMKLIPLGDYYVWHCDWCDSTNYTIWTRMELDGLACAACHKKATAFSESSAAFSRQHGADRSANNLTL